MSIAICGVPTLLMTYRMKKSEALGIVLIVIIGLLIPGKRVNLIISLENRDIPDSVAERGEFELPVPICEQSDDSIRLSFATSRRTAKRYRPAAHF
jgi:hypothetical protein